MLLTVRQVAFIIQVHPNTVINYLSQGKLKGHNPNGDKKGLRITEISVREYVKTYQLENFDEKIYERQIEQATHEQQAKPARRVISQGPSWVKRW